MSRRLATFVGIRSIPIAVVLVVAVACSSPKREIGSDASIAKEPAASTTSATAKPSTPAVAPAANDRFIRSMAQKRFTAVGLVPAINSQTL